MSRIKIFVLYHKPMPEFRSEVFEPIQTGCRRNPKIQGFLHDDGGDNISDKNPWYAELTGNYWAWKNYLPNHPEVEYVGFCHYRRNWLFDKKGTTEDLGFVRKMTYDDYRKIFIRQSSESQVRKALNNADVLLPGKTSFAAYGMTNLDRYLDAGHPLDFLREFCAAAKMTCPEYESDIQHVLAAHDGYYCLNYVMKRDLFVNFMEWIFGILFKMEETVRWDKYSTYETQKSPAYLAERFFNAWLRHQSRERQLKIIERESVLMVSPSEGLKRQLRRETLVRFYHRYVMPIIKRKRNYA